MEREYWQNQLKKEESEEEDLCDCKCFFKERLLVWCRKKFNQPLHPITLQVKDEKMRDKFLAFSRQHVYLELRFFNVVFLVCSFMLLISVMSDITTKGERMLFAIDLPIVGILI